MIDGFRDILLPIDFSEQSLHAAEYAEWFARSGEGTIHLVHVVVNPADPIYELEDQLHWVMVDNAVNKARMLLEGVAAKLIPEGRSHHVHVAVGDPFAKLIEIARDIDADLIVMATRGLGGVTHLVLGSVAAKVIRHAPCPVFVVRQRLAK